MRKTSLAALALLTLVAAGCQTTGRDILSVPVAREYGVVCTPDAFVVRRAGGGA